MKKAEAQPEKASASSAVPAQALIAIPDKGNSEAKVRRETGLEEAQLAQVRDAARIQWPGYSSFLTNVHESQNSRVTPLPSEPEEKLKNSKNSNNKRPASNSGGRIRAVELMAGCARLTRTLRDRGLQVIGVEWLRNKSKPMAPAI
jgi:hypothetical protein